MFFKWAEGDGDGVGSPRSHLAPWLRVCVCVSVNHLARLMGGQKEEEEEERENKKERKERERENKRE